MLWRELDGEAVILDSAAGCSYNLNAVGTVIWKLLDGMHTLDDIAAAICQKYEVEHEQALRDVEHIIEDLRHHNLLVESVSPFHKNAGEQAR
jgi:hypothetical protein